MFNRTSRSSWAGRTIVIAVAAFGLLIGGGVVGIRAAGHSTAATSEAAVRQTSDRAGIALPDASIARAQQRLRQVPGDWSTWAALGGAYLERARISADPSYYPKAEGALQKSLSLRGRDNAEALTGLGALANARHDFAGAAAFARQALAVDPYDAEAYGVLTDALTQLGDAAQATAAVQHMLDLRPGLSAFTRASYDLEQHGRITDAETLMARAAQDAVDPADTAFCRYQLGELAWQDGQLSEAESQYAAGIAADPSYLPLREGQAKVAAARGRIADALHGYADLTKIYPSPAYFLEYADLLRSTGRMADADAQVALAAAAQQLFTANGGTDDLTGSSVALAQGRPADAVRLASKEWHRRHFADVADALAWALHASGRDADALSYARQAGALGVRNAKYSFHLGMIELALGDTKAALRDLKRAKSINPSFSPVDAPALREALARLDAAALATRSALAGRTAS
jgi:tetratricopeptide (TPR) repeat protein